MNPIPSVGLQSTWLVHTLPVVMIGCEYRCISSPCRDTSSHMLKPHGVIAVLHELQIAKSNISALSSHVRTVRACIGKLISEKQGK